MISIDQERCLVAGRRLSPRLWETFVKLHACRNHVIPTSTLFPGAGSENLGRMRIRLLRQALDGTGFSVITHRSLGFEMVES